MDLYEALGENFKYDKVQDIEVTAVAPDWQRISEIEWTGTSAGVYEVKMSMAWEYNTTNKSGCIRYSLDGGTTWFSGCEEPKDKTDTRHEFYSFPIVNDAGGTVSLIVEANKEDSGHTMTIRFCDLILERKG